MNGELPYILCSLSKSNEIVAQYQYSIQEASVVGRLGGYNND